MSLGEAYVTAQINTDTFLPDLKKDLDRILAAEVAKVKLGVDGKHLLASIKEVAEAAKAVEVAVSLKEGDLAAIETELDTFVKKGRSTYITNTVRDFFDTHYETTGFVETRDQLVHIQRLAAEGAKLNITFGKTGLANLQKQIEEEKLSVEIPVTGNFELLRHQLATLQGSEKAKPLVAYFKGEFELVYAEIKAIEDRGLHVNVRPKNLRSFRKDITDGLKRLTPVDVRAFANITAFRARLEAQLNGKDATPFGIRIHADDLRAKIQEQLAAPFRIHTVATGATHGGASPVTSERGFTDPIAEQKLSDAIDRVSVSLREQAAAFKAAGASEAETLSHLRREIEKLEAEARKLKLKVPVEINSTEALAKLELAVERAKTKPIEVPFKADLDYLRAQLTQIGKAGKPIEVPVHADLRFLRAQLALLGGLGATNAPIAIGVRIATSSLEKAYAFAKEFFERAPAIPINIEPRLVPGELAKLRTEAGKIASVSVRVHMTPEDLLAFREQLITAGAAGVRVKLLPAGLTDFRKAIEDDTKFLKANVNIKPGNLQEFRQAISDATKAVKVPIYVEIANLSEVRAAATAGLAGLNATRRPAGTPDRVRVNVDPVVSPKSAEQLRNYIKSLANRELLRQFGGDFKRIESELNGLAGTGKTSFNNIKEAAERAARALLISMGDASKLTKANFDRASTEISAALRRAVRSGERDFTQLAAAAAAAAAKIRAEFAAADLAAGKVGSKSVSGGGFFKRSGADLDAFVQRARGSEAELGSIFARIGSSLDRSVVNVLTNLPKVAAFATVGVAAAFTALDATIAGFGIKAASTFQEAFVQLNAFNTAKLSESMHKAADDADVVSAAFKQTTAQVAELKKLAVDTAFDFPTLADGVRQLQLLEGASGKALFSFKGATATIEVLGDAIATATGKIDPAKLQEVLLPISQAAASGKFLGNDLNQLAQRLPGVFNRKKLLSGLRDELKLTADEFQKLKEGTLDGSKLPFERTLKVILANLREVPGAAGAARRAVDKTLSGQFASFKEGLQQSLAGVFDHLLDPLSKRLPVIEAQLNRAFQSLGPGIGKLVLTVVDSLATVIPALLKAAVAFNTAFGGIFGAAGSGFASLLNGIAAVLPGIAAFFKQIADNLAPAVPAAKAIAVAIASLSAGALLVISEIIGDLGRNLAGPAELFKEIAGLLFVIARSDAGKALGEVAAALITIKTLTAVSTILKGIATGLFSVGAGGVAAGAGLTTFRAGLAAALGPIALLVAGILAVNEALSKVGITLSAAGIGKDIKGFFGGIADGLINATQATGNFLSKLANAVPGVHIDTTEFNSKLDAANDKILSVGQQLKNIDGTVATADVVIRITQLKTEFEKKQTGSSIFTKPLLDKEPAFSLTQEQQQSQEIDKQLAALSDGFKNGADAAGSGAKSAAETLADRIKAAKEKILESLVDFKKTISEGSAKEIDAAFKSLRKSLQTIPNFDESGLVKKLRADNAKLDKLANQRDALTKRIEDRISKFNSIFDSLRSTSEAISAAADSASTGSKKLFDTLKLDVAGSVQVIRKTIDATGAAAAAAGKSFATALSDRVKALKDFKAEIDALKKAGLNSETLDALVSAGPGSDLATSLQGASGAVIKSVNASQKQIDKLAASIAGTGAVISEQADAAATAAGKSVVDGLVKGLKDQKSKIVSEITDLVNTIIKLVKKGLKIASPSKVMASLAAHIPTGLAKGVGDNMHHVTGAMSKMVDAVSSTKFAAPSLGEISSAGLADAQARLGKLNLPEFKTDINAIQRQRADISTTSRMHPSDLRALVAANELRNAPVKEIHATVHQTFTTPTTPSEAAFSGHGVMR